MPITNPNPTAAQLVAAPGAFNLPQGSYTNTNNGIVTNQSGQDVTSQIRLNGPALNQTAQTTQTKSPVAVVTSGPATQNYNNIQQDYSQNIAPKVAAASQATTQAQTQSNSLPVIDGYNVSANPTGNAGETKATNNTTGQSYYITPQDQKPSADDVKSLLGGSDSSSQQAGTSGISSASNSVPTPSQTASSQTGTNPATENSNYQSQLQNQENELDQGYASFKNTIQQIQSGAFPLSSSQQALVDATNQAFQQMTSQANLKAAALSSETGGVANKVTAATGELTNITSAQAAAVAKLEIGFQQQDYQMVTDAYKSFQDYESQKSGVIDKLHSSIMDTYNAAQEAAQKVSDNVNSVALDAAKNGADANTLAAIKAAPDEGSAISAAGGYLQSATGTLGDYLQYKKDTESKGLTPLDYQSYKDNETAKSNQNDINKAVAIQKAKNQTDEEFTESDKNQQKLEQQYRGVLSKEFSSRTGSLGIENSKVNQANHLNSLFEQYYDPKSGQYNIPKSQYGEVVLGLANLISPTGTASDSLRDEITQKTLKGDIAGAASYISGVPMTGSTQDVFKNLVDSVDRQATTAVANREAALQNLRDQAPTDLDQDRIDRLNKSTNMVSYAGQERVDKSIVNDYIKSNPAEAEDIAKLYEIPGATDSDIVAYLKAQGKI